jgi:DNA-directed RNA polymerase subunit RPC12/RpoP
MELLYCSRCQRAIPPGGPDEGKHFQLGDEIICPKCYYKTKPGDHSGATVPVRPVSDERLLGAGRITPAEAARPHKPPTTKSPAFKPPTSRIMPAAKRPPSASSSRLRAVREPNSRRRLAVPLGLAAGLIIAALAVFLWTRSREPDRPAGNGTRPIGSGAQPLPAPDPGRPPGLPPPKPEPEPPRQPRPVFTPTPTPSPDPAGGLVLHFKLDEKDGTAVRDSSGGGHDGKVIGGVKWTAGQIGGAAEFAGVPGADFGITTVAKLSVNTAVGSRNTVAFWMNWGGEDDQMPFAWGSGYNLWLKDGRFGFSTGEGGVLGAGSAGLPGRWVHVAAVFPNAVPDAANCKLHLNGQAQALAWKGGAAGERMKADPIVFLARWWQSDGHRFRGLIDDLRIYSRELTPEEIVKLAKGEEAPAPKPGPAPGSTERPVANPAPFSVTLKAYRGTRKKPSLEAAGSANSFQVGAVVASDRGEKWKRVPEELAGMTRLLAAREDRTSKPAGQLYVVNVSGPCTVYLPLDTRYGGKKLSWMDDSWKDSGLTCDRDVGGGSLRIWRKSVAEAGDQELGCDTFSEAIGMCYVFAPAAADKENPDAPEPGPPGPK